MRANPIARWVDRELQAVEHVPLPSSAVLQARERILLELQICERAIDECPSRIRVEDLGSLMRDLAKKCESLQNMAIVKASQL